MDRVNLVYNISPPKCGTTSLYKSLIDSNGISRSEIKEPRYFCKDRLDQHKGLPQGLELHGNFKNGFNWHEQLFKESSKYRIDFTTYYSISEDAPQLIYDSYPNAKGIFVLREPVKRFISHYYQYKKMGINLPPLSEVIAGDGVLSRFMFSFSDYSSIYHRFAKVFGEENILVLPFEDLVSQKSLVSDELCAFLQLPDIGYAPSERQKYGSGVPRFKYVQKFFFNGRVRQCTRLLHPSVKVSLLKVRRRIFQMNTRKEQYPEIDAKVRSMLTHRLHDSIEFYKETVRNVAMRRVAIQVELPNDFHRKENA